MGLKMLLDMGKVKLGVFFSLEQTVQIISLKSFLHRGSNMAAATGEVAYGNAPHSGCGRNLCCCCHKQKKYFTLNLTLPWIWDNG
jgi:hypothetical protein